MYDNKDNLLKKISNHINKRKNFIDGLKNTIKWIDNNSINNEKDVFIIPEIPDIYKVYFMFMKRNKYIKFIKVDKKRNGKQYRKYLITQDNIINMQLYINNTYKNIKIYKKLKFYITNDIKINSYKEGKIKRAFYWIRDNVGK